MTIFRPFAFFKQVRSEISKVKWPNRKETGISIIMVFFMIVIISIFFFFIDWIISCSINYGVKILKQFFI